MRLLAIGSAITDEIIQIERLPLSGQDISAQASWTELGGCAANVAVCAARMGISSAILCRIGPDQRGRFVTSKLRAEGVDISHIRTDLRHQSGYCLSLVEKTGERTFITFDGANLQWSEEDISQQIINQYTILYISGYELVPPVAASLLSQALQRAVQAKAMIVFDPGPVIKEIPREIFAKVASISTMLIPNEDEARSFFAKTGSLEEWAENLYSLGPKTVLIKLGARGCYYKDQFGQGLVPGYKVTQVDSSGAGDAFAGACIYGLATATPLPQTLSVANAVGAMVAAQSGPQAPIPTLVELKAFIQEYNQE